MATSTAAPPRFRAKDRFESVWEFVIGMCAGALVEGTYWLRLLTDYAMWFVAEWAIVWMQGTFLAHAVQPHTFVDACVQFADQGLAAAVVLAGAIEGLKHVLHRGKMARQVEHEAEIALKGGRHHEHE